MPDEDRLLFGEFFIGMELPGYTHTVTGEQIDEYCASLGEDNPIYLDDEAAREAGFEGRVAPPMMVRDYAHFQNVFTGFKKTLPAHSIHAAGEYDFINPVRPGDIVTTTGKVIDKYIKKDRKYLCFELISKNQNGDIVVINRHTSVWPK
jgi:acyl dehydratase